MGRSVAVWVVAGVLTACGTAQTPSSQAFDAGSIDPVDAGDPVPPPSLTFHTALGTLVGSEAFPIASAQTLLQADGGGPQTYVGFQVSDAAQCVPSDADGGAMASPLPVTHVLTGFVRTFDGTQVQLGTYNIGQNNPNQVQAYVEMVEFDRATGSAQAMLATSGTLTVAALSSGNLEASTNVNLGDPVTQLELPFSGSFTSEVCAAPTTTP